MPPLNRRKGFVAAPEGYRRCVRCGGETEIRVRKIDGARFIGCREFPLCRWTRELPDAYEGERYDPSRVGLNGPRSRDDFENALKRLTRRLEDPALGRVQKLRIKDTINDIQRHLVNLKLSR
jgi:hypothetical protein